MQPYHISQCLKYSKYRTAYSTKWIGDCRYANPIVADIHQSKVPMYELSSVHIFPPALPHITYAATSSAPQNNPPNPNPLSPPRKEGKKEGRKARGITYRFGSFMHLLTLESIGNNRMRSPCIDFVLHLARYVRTHVRRSNSVALGRRRRSLGRDRLFLCFCRTRQGGCRVGLCCVFPISGHLSPFQI